jgi:DNA invertase Pin-like site-specific DNA recombinase
MTNLLLRAWLARRVGRTMTFRQVIACDEVINGATGRHSRPGLDALLKGVARREFDIVAAWSVCRLGRSLSDLIGLMDELRSRDIDLYLHQQALDTSTLRAAPCSACWACSASSSGR